MSIVKLKKITMFAPNDRKEELITLLQELGLLHIINLKEKQLVPNATKVTDLQNIREALQIIENTPSKRPIIKYRTINAHDIVKEIIDIRQQIEQTKEKLCILATNLEEVKPWGNFSIPTLTELGNLQLWFYKIPIKYFKKLTEDYAYNIVSKDNNYIYTVVISKTEPELKKLHAVHVVITKGLTEINREIEEAQTKLEDLRDKRRELTQYRSLLFAKTNEFEDATDFLAANDSTLDYDKFFVLSAWIEASKIAKIEELCAKNKVSLLVEEAKDTDQTPTLLKNNKLTNAGKLLIDFYQSPGYYTIDPSAIILFSFAIFFAMILADAGYGLILSVFFLYKFNKIKKQNNGQQLITLFGMICIFSICYGVLAGSYFGTPPRPSSFLAKLKILPVTDFGFMMKFSIIIGISHILLANIMLAIKSPFMYQKAKSIGFGLIVIAGFCYYLKYDVKLSMAVLIIASLILIIFSGNYMATNLKTFLVKCLQGSISVSSIIKLFGDVMSYMRLFALGLAGASLSVTFNSLANDVFQTKGIGMLIGLIILLFGHGLNLLISIISGVVHGLRLNYIEFFNWSVPEEGIKFKLFYKRGATTWLA